MFEEYCDSNETYTIYSLINNESGKRYIGKTKQLKQRLRTHFRNLKKGVHINKELQKDFERGFSIEVLEEGIERWDSVKKEKYYMVKYKTYDQNFGYNSNDTYFVKNGKPTKARKSIGDKNVC